MKLDESLGFLINHAGRRISQLLTHHYQSFDITTEQWVVLNRLAEQDGISQKELSLRAEKDQTNVTRILDHLQRKGFIERRSNPLDRRSFLAFITDKGRELNQQLIPIEEQVIQSILRGVTEEELNGFTKVLVHITNNANQDIRHWEET